MSQETIFISVAKKRVSDSLDSTIQASKVKSKEAKIIQEFEVLEEFYQDQIEEKKIRIEILEGRIAELNEGPGVFAAAEILRLEGELVALGPLPSRVDFRPDFITFLENRGLNTIRATRFVDIYLTSRMQGDTTSLTQQLALSEIGAETQQDTLFFATANVVKAATFEDIEDIVSRERENALQTSAHRPGHPPRGNNTLEDIFNDDKIRPNEPRYASLRVLKPTGTFGAAVKQESSTNPTPGFTTLFETNEFLLQATNEQQNEKFQIVETFGDPTIFAFGARQEIYTYAGVLLNTNTFQWKNKFLKNYNDFLRLSRTIEQGARVFLTYDDVIREGHVLNFAVQHADRNLNHVVFSFSMFIIRKIFIGDDEALLTELQALANDKVQNERQVQEAVGSLVQFQPPNVFALNESLLSAADQIEFRKLIADGGVVSKDLENHVRRNMINTDGTLRAAGFPFKASEVPINSPALQKKIYDFLVNMPAIN